MNKDTRPKLSIVIPTLNEERYLAQTLDSMARQTANQKDYEILLYDGASSDRTREIASEWSHRFKNFRLQNNPSRLPASARNRGLQDARGDAIAFVEGHCILPEHYVQRAIELFQETDADALGRPIDLVVDSDPLTQQGIGVARMSRLGHAASSLLYSNVEGPSSSISCATIYRREVFAQLGRFDEQLSVAEDVDFNKRFEKAGLQHYFSQELRCGYHPRRSLAEFGSQMYEYGLGRTRSALKTGAVSALDFLPPVLCATILNSAVGAFLWLPLAIPAAAYFLIALLYAAYLSCSRRRPYLTGIVFLAFLVIHFGTAVGQCMSFIERRHEKNNEPAVAR